MMIDIPSYPQCQSKHLDVHCAPETSPLNDGLQQQLPVEVRIGRASVKVTTDT